MTKKFVVRDGVIENVIMCDDSYSVDGAELISAENVHGDIGWSVVDGVPVDPTPPPTEEELAASIRARRDGLLLKSDWTQLPDVPEGVKAAWAIYRQELRDITLQDGFPTEVTWPEQP
jgi:hypothetical protein